MTRRLLKLGVGVAAFYYFMDADFVTYFSDFYRSRYDSNGMRDKTIWIVGASSGIGEYVAYELVKSGAKRIILSARRRDKLENVKKECERILSQINQQRSQESTNKMNSINSKIEEKIQNKIAALTSSDNDSSDSASTAAPDPDKVAQIEQTVRKSFEFDIRRARNYSQSELECEIIIKPLDVMRFVNEPNAAQQCVDDLMQRLNSELVAESDFGGLNVETADIDIMVINAGRTQHARALACDQLILLHLQQLNVFAPIALSQAMAKYWRNNINSHRVSRKNKKLHQIAITSSLSGILGVPKSSAYSMTKSAINRFMEAMRLELVDDKTDINLICPGPVALTEDSYNSLGETLEQEGINRLHVMSQSDRMSLDRCASLYVTALQYSLTESWISESPPLLISYLRQYTPILLGPVGRIIGPKYSTET